MEERIERIEGEVMEERNSDIFTLLEQVTGTVRRLDERLR